MSTFEIEMWRGMDIVEVFCFLFFSLFMKYYLSSFGFGDHISVLHQRLKPHAKVGFIVNAGDNKSPDDRIISNQTRLQELLDQWRDAVILDLQDYFGKTEELRAHMSGLDMIRVKWWNTFVLRKAMALCGCDTILQEFHETNYPIVYGWYSAGVCILSPTLKYLDIVDNPNIHPYPQMQKTLRDGLNIIPYCVAPHYRSDHSESADIEKEVQRMIDHKVLFKALRDSEVIIIDQH